MILWTQHVGFVQVYASLYLQRQRSKRLRQHKEIKSDLQRSFETVHILGQLQCDESFGLSFYALSPKFKFGVDGTVEDKIVFEPLSLKGTDWRVMTNLL